MKWYLHVLKNYAQFNGRARRTEYWMFALINIIFAGVAVIIDNVAGIAIDHLYSNNRRYLAAGPDGYSQHPRRKSIWCQSQGGDGLIHFKYSSVII